MNKITQFGLTLAAALVLSACSGGGSGGDNSHNQQAPKTEITPPTTTQPSVKQSEQPNVKPSEQPMVNSPKEPMTNQPEQPIVNPPKEPMVNQPEQPMVNPPKEPMVNQPEQPMVNPPKEPMVNQPEQPMVNPPKEPMVDQPIVNQPEPERKSDQEVFKDLDKQIGILASIQLNGKNLELVPLSSDVEFTEGKVIETVRDSDGTLLGFYGHLRGTKLENINYKDEKQHYYESFVDMDSAPKTQPTQNMRYDGKMYYGYSNIKQPLVGTVLATYHQSDKQFNMQITADNRDSINSGVWQLGYMTKKQRVKLDSDGNIAGKLYSENDNAPNGTFFGSIYGKNGDILVGKAQSIDESKESWYGVIGAKGTVEK